MDTAGDRRRRWPDFMRNAEMLGWLVEREASHVAGI